MAKFDLSFLKSKKVVLSVLAGIAVIVLVTVFDVPFVDAPETFEKLQACLAQVTPVEP
jgi:hypothetical protein